MYDGRGDMVLGRDQVPVFNNRYGIVMRSRDTGSRLQIENAGRDVAFNFVPDFAMTVRR